MLTSLLDTVRNKAAAVEAYLTLCELRDEALAAPEISSHPSFSVVSKLDPEILKNDRVFRHCSVITHLYAVYETFVESSLAAWLSRMPKYRRFSDLETTLQNAYRVGIATVIKDIKKRQFRSLSLPNVLDKYVSSVKNYTPWQFVTEALTLHENNLRKSELEKLFNVVGISNLWSILQGDPRLKKNVSTLTEGKTLELLLEDFVTFRNEASHGMPDDLLGLESLRQWIRFTVSLCESIKDVLTITFLKAERGLNPDCVIGVVSEKFSGNRVVAKCRNCELSVGQRLHFLKPSAVVTATIESLQLNDADMRTLTVGAEEMEVGIRTSHSVKKHSEVFLGEF